jgi:Rod binding domain-containing protein
MQAVRSDAVSTGVNTLKKPADSSRDPAAIKKAASQFEAIILRQLLAPAIEPMMSGGLGGAQSSGGGVYGYMLTDTLSNSLAQGGGLGLARMLEKQLTPRGTVVDNNDNSQTNAHSQLHPLKLP